MARVQSFIILLSSFDDIIVSNVNVFFIKMRIFLYKQQANSITVGMHVLTATTTE